MEEKTEFKISKSRLATYALLLMAVVILVVSVVQAYQIAALDGGQAGASSGSGSYGASSAQQGAGQAAAQQAPAMVGGC